MHKLASSKQQTGLLHPRSRQPNLICKLTGVVRAQINTSRAQEEGDVIVVGAGIVGISVCRQILRQSGGSCRVHLVDNRLPGHATGAGQGYIWMAHRQVGTPAWSLAQWSCQKWAESLTAQLRAAIEWQDTGSILLANGSEADQLKEQAEHLQQEGLHPELLSSCDIVEAVPALRATESMTGLLLKSDAQINGRQAAKALLSECHQFGSAFVLHSPKTADSLDINSSGTATGIGLGDGTRIVARKGVVITAGAWSGPLLSAALKDRTWESSLKPRKGHLLEVSWPQGEVPLKYGLMEIGYTKHYKFERGALSQQLNKGQDPSEITFTATMSAAGTCLLGSSREFSGFSSTPSHVVQQAILARARAYLPAMDSVQVSDPDTRVGLRPYSSQGPLIGPVPGCRNLFLASGHEGSGLTLAPGTACLIANMILSESLPDFAQSLRPEAVLAS